MYRDTEKWSHVSLTKGRERVDVVTGQTACTHRQYLIPIPTITFYFSINNFTIQLEEVDQVGSYEVECEGADPWMDDGTDSGTHSS